MNKDLLREKKAHGDAMFPLNVYELTYEQEETIIDCHWHDEFEIVLITKGRAFFQVETISYEIGTGEAIFIGSGQIHAAYTVNTACCGFCAMVFSPALLCSNHYDAIQSKFIDPFIKKQFPLPIPIQGKTPWGQEVLAGLKEILTAWAVKPYAYELFVKAKLYLMLAALISNAAPVAGDPKQVETEERIEKLKQVLNYIHENYAAKINVEDLARLIHMSEGYFYRFFRQMTRKTPIEYLNSYRINKAAILLRESRKKIFEIALDVGFDNFSYFISIFKKLMKCTPLEYRKFK
ncbi:MAG: AraC family transcriptional regulator [Firmicutes bacterium]|nr:AraC family transcriptional regulator [Bacillota bacterium]